ncbi:MAG: hypothetical protein M3O55_11090 [Actinomycetota bacterium]|nr:hypothetical protein [Actinomycetota bacterium]
MPERTYSVRAQPWAHGWELYIEGVGVTLSATLADAERQVRDYISLLLDVPDDSFEVQVAVSADGDGNPV